MFESGQFWVFPYFDDYRGGVRARMNACYRIYFCKVAMCFTPAIVRGDFVGSRSGSYYLKVYPLPPLSFKLHEVTNTQHYTGERSLQHAVDSPMTAPRHICNALHVIGGSGVVVEGEVWAWTSYLADIELNVMTAHVRYVR